ncbi:hypothetical protein [Streptomyces sp. CB01580]|uniref:hypothetical protein n=1 Tax=Streptomyces sp. CB01580 TaxID=1703933 RepID=UPI00093F842D|nr:hypothetical protein [Streptomyces sp. CB01580]OKJ42344.1 hypothetical protein AMK22_05465 [Streptomyces sp. CB01580]
MNTGRIALIVTCLSVAVLGIWLTVVRWDDASKVATVVSALGAVAAVGVAIWATLQTPPTRGPVVVSRTGRATARSGGRAITGLTGRADGAGSVRVEHTGDAESSGGDAITGFEQK